ncbi:hypothetical protein ACROYT_G040225, partial [Oculina patagonica]
MLSADDIHDSMYTITPIPLDSNFSICRQIILRVESTQQHQHIYQPCNSMSSKRIELCKLKYQRLELPKPAFKIRFLLVSVSPSLPLSFTEQAQTNIYAVGMRYRMSWILRHPVVSVTRALRFA